MKLFQATALVAVFLVEDAFSFAEISTALKRSTTESVSVPREWKKQDQGQCQFKFRLQDVPRPDLYNDSMANLEETVPGFLAGSSLIYGYASLRSLINKHDRAVRKGVPAKTKGNWFGRNKKDEPLYDFMTPALLVTQDGAQPDRGRYLKYDITAQAILEFLELNRKLLKQEEKTGNILVEESKVEHPPLDFEKLLKSLIALKQDARITEFDDQFSSSELVYGITQDITNKRITVFFRGSVTDGKDWNTNFNALYTQAPVPALLQTVPLEKDIKLHRGFYRYLHAPGSGKGENTKFDTIVKNLKEVLAEKQNDGFELFITGHSLGGALCQLLSYELASYSEIGENDPFPLPIRAISFASPQIGNKEGFAQAYQALEKAGRVRHLRVTNEGDAVPEAPFGFGYAQTGVKVHVKENEPAEVGYNIVMNIVRQIGFDSGEMHKLSNYQKHLFNSENKELLKETIDQLYQNEAGIEAPQASLVAK